MGGISIWHWAVVALIVLPCLLPLVIQPPAGPNRFGEPPSPKTFTTAIQTAFGKFFDFSGRASRSEYWYFYLFQFLLGIALQVAIAIAPDVWSAVFILNIGFILPFIALTARRLHDRNRSGWWQLIALTGLGAFVMLVWMMLPARDET